MRSIAIVVVTAAAASACWGPERDADSRISLLGGRAWVAPATPYAVTHALAVAFIDRDGDGQLTTMAEPSFPCEAGGRGAPPRCQFRSRRAVVNSYSSTSKITGERHEGLAIWVQDGSARPAAIPFCTQLGCSREQPPFFDLRAANGSAFHQYWVCTSNPADEIGVIELDVGGEKSDIDVRPHLAVDIEQRWVLEGRRISVVASIDVSRVSVRVTRAGEPVWSSEQPDAMLNVEGGIATAVIPANATACDEGDCVLVVDVAHIWKDEAALVLSASHLEEPLLPSRRP
jgi:hypothetical protein